jgi:hypothetical protein
MAAMRTTSALALLSFLTLVACGDNLTADRAIDAANDAFTIDTAQIDATPIDARDIDASIDANCPARAPGQVGGPCTDDRMCDSVVGTPDGLCFRGPQGATTWPAEGYCVNKVQLSVNDGCMTDTDCGTGNLCATIDDPGGPFRACLPACGAGACACSNGQLCAASFSGSAILNGDTACLPGNSSATDGDACNGFGECALDSLCLLDPLEYPGGQCHRVTCTIGTDSTCAAGGDGHCIDYRLITAGLNVANVCVDTCTADADCRQSDGYRCFDGGAGVGRFCRHPQAGDACAVDADCGNPAQWDCKTGLTFPGGMCTPTTGCSTPGDGTGCSPGSSICYDSILPAIPGDNVCADRCGGPINTQGGCRTGYVCRDTNPLAPVVLGCVNP